MDFGWLSFANPVALWWMFLVSASLVNILAWTWTWKFRRPLPRPMIWLSAAYVFGCAFRSFLPRADVQRLVLFDGWISSVFVGRSVATVAEISYVAQWALVLGLLGRAADGKAIVRLSYLLVPLICFAECCSWFGVITTNYIGNVVEESTWTATYALITFSLLFLWPRFKGALQYVLGTSAVGSFMYVVFMTTVDVPMYFGRWQADLASGKRFLGFAEGIYDLNTRWTLTHDIGAWATEIPWMSLYFSIAVLVSIGMCYLPLTVEGLRNYRRA